VIGDPARGREVASLRRSFEETRQELADMAGEIRSAEERITELARQDIQVGELRELLHETRERHLTLEGRERALRLRFEAVLADQSGRLH
jgi:chromosome segregation ATPase